VTAGIFGTGPNLRQRSCPLSFLTARTQRDSFAQRISEIVSNQKKAHCAPDEGIPLRRSSFILPMRGSSAVVSPFGMYRRRNREVYRSAPPARSRWRLWAGGWSGNGRRRGPFPDGCLRNADIVKSRYAFPLPARSPRCRHKMGSGIHRWAYPLTSR
jgi:hypothetical protein